MGLCFLSGGAGSQTASIAKIAIDLKSGEAKSSPTALLSGLEIGPGLTVSVDGEHLAYIRAHAHSNLWLADSPGAFNGAELQAKPLTSGTAYLDWLSISPDGTWLAFVKGHFLFKMPIDGGSPTQLTFSDTNYFGTAWSPDGKWIAVGSDEGGTNKVWLIGADGGANPRQMVNTKLNAGNGDITWWPGSRILYHKPGNRNFAILDARRQAKRSP